MCDYGIFADVIANNFEGIKRSFISRSKNMGIDFDEDIFMDDFIKCCTTLKDKRLSKQDCLNYFWRAYVNSIKTPIRFEVVSLDDPNRGSIVPDLPPSYNYTIDQQYQEITDKLINKFGLFYTEAFILHYAEEKSYKELIEMGYNFKHNNIFKRMVKYIRS